MLFRISICILQMKLISFDSRERNCVDKRPEGILDTLGEDTCLLLLVECLNISICKYFSLLVICGGSFQGKMTSVKVIEKRKRRKA